MRCPTTLEFCCRTTMPIRSASCKASATLAVGFKVDGPRSPRIRMFKPALQLGRDPKAEALTGDHISHWDSRCFRVETDLISYLELLHLRHHALDVSHRNPDKSLEEFVGIEPSAP